MEHEQALPALRVALDRSSDTDKDPRIVARGDKFARKSITPIAANDRYRPRVPHECRLNLGRYATPSFPDDQRCHPHRIKKGTVERLLPTPSADNPGSRAGSTCTATTESLGSWAESSQR